MSGAAGALYVLLFIGFLSGVPSDLFDAAKLDRAGFLRTFWLILQLAKPVIAVVVIFQFVSNWNEFNIPLVSTLGQPWTREDVLLTPHVVGRCLERVVQVVERPERVVQGIRA